MWLNILFMICVVAVPIIAIITGYTMKTRPPKGLSEEVCQMVYCSHAERDCRHTQNARAEEEGYKLQS